MNEAVTLLLSCGAGGALGLFFFGGLWWTVRKSVTSNWAAFWVLGSLFVRMSLVLAGLYFVSGGRWERMLACLLGFIIARQFVTWRTRLWEINQTNRTREASHAP